MSQEDEDALMSQAVFAKYGFKIGDFVEALRPKKGGTTGHGYDPNGVRFIVGMADPPYGSLFWVKDVRNGKATGRQFREYASRLRPLAGGVLAQMAFQPPPQRPSQERPQGS